MNARDLIESLNNLDEHERIEAKRAEQVGPTVMESVCAFANEPNLSGGWLLLAAEREEMALFPSYAVSGLDDPSKFFTRDFKAVLAKYHRALVPEYVKDYVSLISSPPEP